MSNFYLHFSANYTESCKSETSALLACMLPWIHVHELMAQLWMENKERNAAVLVLLSRAQTVGQVLGLCLWQHCCNLPDCKRSPVWRWQFPLSLSYFLWPYARRPGVGASKNSKSCPLPSWTRKFHRGGTPHSEDYDKCGLNAKPWEGRICCYQEYQEKIYRTGDLSLCWKQR